MNEQNSAEAPRAHPGPTGLRLASMEDRSEARTIDAAISVCFCIVLVVGCALWSWHLHAGTSVGDDTVLRFWHVTLVLMVPVVMAFHGVMTVVVPSRLRGMTVGKRLVGIRVVKEDGSEATLNDHAMRCPDIFEANRAPVRHSGPFSGSEELRSYRDVDAGTVVVVDD